MMDSPAGSFSLRNRIIPFKYPSSYLAGLI